MATPIRFLVNKTITKVRHVQLKPESRADSYQCEGLLLWFGNGDRLLIRTSDRREVQWRCALEFEKLGDESLDGLRFDVTSVVDEEPHPTRNVRSDVGN